MFPATGAERGRGAFSQEGGGASGGGLESIYNLLPKLKEETVKPAMYRSVVNHDRYEPNSIFNQRKAKGSTFGIKGGGRSMDPNNFLRVGEGIEARRRAGKRPELPRLTNNCGSRGGEDGGGGGDGGGGDGGGGGRSGGGRRRGGGGGGGGGGSGGGGGGGGGGGSGGASGGGDGSGEGRMGRLEGRAGGERSAEGGGSNTPSRIRRKPPVPWREDCPPMGLHSAKNFVTANAVDAILATPANRHLPPVNYLEKEDFGKVPEYLAHVKAEIVAENAMVEQFVREQMGLSNEEEVRSRLEDISDMPIEEQADLVDKLKAKWDSVNARYQLLTHQTLLENGRLVVKARLEKELDELEADLSLLTGGPIAVVPRP